MRKSLTLTVAALLLFGCSKSPSPATPTPTPEVSAWSQVLGQLEKDQPYLPTALAAFALAIGPMPGAKVPSGPKETIHSGTLAIRWATVWWTKLTSQQQAAFQTAIGAPAVSPRSFGGPSPSASPSKNPHLPCQTKDSVGAQPYRAQFQGIAAAISAKLGRPLKVQKEVFFALNKADLEGSALMYTYPCNGMDDQNGEVKGCTIHVNPRAASHGADDVTSMLTHEIFHCFQYDKIGRSVYHQPTWYIEGGAMWVETVLGPRSSVVDKHWKSYLDNPDRPLTARTYDGLGFFVHLAESGVDPWTVMDKIGAAMKGQDLRTVAGWNAAGVTASFLETWGSSLVAGQYPGKAWNSGGPGIPAYQPKMGKAVLGNGATVRLASRMYGAMVKQLDVTAEVVIVAPGAATTGRLTVGGGAEALLSATNLYCTIKDCSCPDSEVKFAPMTPGYQFVGFAAGDKAGSVILTGQSLKDFCKRPPPSKSCLVGQWKSQGFDIKTENITEKGGAGISLVIDPAGNTKIVFNGMQPVVFTSDQDVNGSMVFSGTVSGRLILPPGDVTSGDWHEATPATFPGLSVTMKLTDPFPMTLGPWRLDKLAAEGGGHDTSDRPLLENTWECNGDTLTTHSAAATGTWTLKRVS